MFNSCTKGSYILECIKGKYLFISMDEKEFPSNAHISPWEIFPSIFYDPITLSKGQRIKLGGLSIVSQTHFQFLHF